MRGGCGGELRVGNFLEGWRSAAGPLNEQTERTKHLQTASRWTEISILFLYFTFLGRHGKRGSGGKEGEELRNSRSWTLAELLSRKEESEIQSASSNVLETTVENADEQPCCLQFGMCYPGVLLGDTDD